MFLVEKQSGEIKTRACASGSMQQQYISKENAASPIINNESMFITAAIEAHERMNVVTLDISWHTFTQTQMRK